MIGVELNMLTGLKRLFPSILQGGGASLRGAQQRAHLGTQQHGGPTSLLIPAKRFENGNMGAGSIHGASRIGAN